MQLNITKTAKVCHEVNRAYCQSIGDESQLPWENAPDWQKESAQNGVIYHLTHPASQPSDSHENWMKEKIAAGWKHGPVKDAAAKTHPCLLPYGQLPLQQRTKDYLFLAVVRAMEGE